MTPALAVVLLLFALAYGGVAVFAARRPLLRRLALREALRRRWHSLLVVAGLMVGTATITGALIAADSVGDSAVDAFAYGNWHHIDLTVTSSRGTFPEEVVDRLADSPQVRSVVDGVAGGIELVGSAADLTSRQGSSRVTLVGFDPSAQAPFGSFVLLDGSTTDGADLAPGEVLLSRTLADKLDARIDDRLVMGLEPSTSGTAGSAAAEELRVAGIARQEGPGAYTLGSVVFAPLETAQRVAGTGGVNIVRISVPGGVRDTLEASGRARPVLEEATGTLGRELSIPLEVREAKAGDVENATEFTTFIRFMLIGMSALVAAAGAALVVNLIGMLAEERRSRLGVLRALGLRRRSLVGLSVIEGALYSLAAGIVGMVVGLAAGRVSAGGFARAFAEFAGEDFDFAFHFSLRPATLAAGFAAGSFLTLAVVFLASRRTARMTITAAIRNLPEPAGVGRAGRGRRRGIVAGGLALLGLAAIAMPGPFPRVLGGIVLIWIAAVATRDRFSPRVHATLTGLALAAWSFAMVAGIAPEEEPGTFFLVFVIAMLTSVFGLTSLASANLHVAETVVGLLGRAFAGLRAILRPPLAYLARRPLRTGLTTGVFAVIVGMLTLFAVFFSIFRPDYERFGGGFDVRVLSTGAADIRVPDAVSREVDRAYLIPTRGYIGPVRSDDPFSNSERLFVPLLEVSQNVADDPPVRLEQRADGYASDREVWEAVARDPSLVVGNLAQPGQQVVLQGPDGPRAYTIVGLQPFGMLEGLIGTAEALAPFEELPRGATMLLDLHDRSRAAWVARTTERELFSKGVDAESVQALLDTADRANRAFFSTIDVLMRMGLVVGILSLGIVALRIVIERRHVIGVMRALGFRRRGVMAGLLAEATVTATIGAAVGLVVGVTMGYLFYLQEETQPGFGIDLASIGGVLALIYVAVLLVTVGPAWQASRLPPAEAVRYTE